MLSDHSHCPRSAAPQVCTQRSWKRPYGVGLLVAGYDKTGPHLYNTCPSANYYEYKAMAIGARSQVGVYVLRAEGGMPPAKHCACKLMAVPLPLAALLLPPLCSLPCPLAPPWSAGCQDLPGEEH